MSTPLLTTAEAAARLGLTVRAVQKMIEAGRLSAQKLGRDYFIAPDALESIPKQAAGRPPKVKTNGAPKDPAATTAQLNKAFRKAKEAEEASKVSKAEKNVLKSEAPKQTRAKRGGKK